MHRPSDDASAKGLPRSIACVAIVAAALPFRGAQAADLPPPLMARFTRAVQPLLLNKCAAGACHGGPAAHPPRLHRGDGAGHVDRQITLANIQALTALVPPGDNAATVIAAISGRHPADAPASMPTAVPLSTQERATLQTWLDAALAHNAGRAGVQRTAHAEPARQATRPTLEANRFRAMLDAAANPPPLPPPQHPQGLILGADGQPRRR